MTAITAPTLFTDTLTAGQIATVAANPRGTALVQLMASGLLVAQAQLGTGQTQRFGPYASDVTVNVRAYDGVFEYTAATASSAQSPTVAGVALDGNFDIPVASLRTALAAALAVGGVAPSGGGLDVAASALSTALAATMQSAIASAQSITWANLAITSGTYDGQRQRLPSLDGLGGWVYVVWNSIKAQWEPDGVQTLASLKRIVDDTPGTTSAITIPSITLPGGPFWKETLVEIAIELTSTVNGCTAGPVQMSLGAMTLINDTTQPTRAKRFSRPVRFQDTAVQYCHARGDNQYSSFSNLTAGALTGTVNSAADMTLTAGVDTGWVNASSHALSMEMYDVLWRR